MKIKLVLFLLALALSAGAGAETKYVQVDKTRLLTKPSAFSKAKATLPYRTRVDVLGQEGAYARVRTGAGEGYLPARSLSAAKPAFTAKLSKQYVSSDEVAMATKGFNAQVESEYRRKNPALPYDELDRLEKQTSYPDAASAFLAFRKTGKLGEYREGGDAQ